MSNYFARNMHMVLGMQNAIQDSRPVQTCNNEGQSAPVVCEAKGLCAGWKVDPRRAQAVRHVLHHLRTALGAGCHASGYTWRAVTTKPARAAEQATTNNMHTESADVRERRLLVPIKLPVEVVADSLPLR